MPSINKILKRAESEQEVARTKKLMSTLDKEAYFLNQVFMGEQEFLYQPITKRQGELTNIAKRFDPEVQKQQVEELKGIKEKI